MTVVDGARRRPVPLRQRRMDLVFVAFFLVNVCFIMYCVDPDQVAAAARRASCRPRPGRAELARFGTTPRW